MEGTELTLLITACSGALISIIVALQKSRLFFLHYLFYALIGFIISVGLATSKFNDVFDELCKKRKDKDKDKSKRVVL